MKNKTKTELGIFIKSPTIEVIECCGIMELDFVILDMEHTPLGPRDLYPLVLASENRNLKMIIRLPNLNEEYFKWCLDLGVSNLQIPQIETIDDVKKAVKYSFFNPKGHRGLCRHVRAADFSNLDKGIYLKNENSSTNLIFQIEGKKGLNSLDIILGSEMVDNILIGPYDLSQSLGYPGDIWNDIVTSKMDKIIKKCKDRSIKVGVYTDTIDGIKYWTDRNIDYIEYGSDMMLLSDSIKKLKKLKV
tara:strand:+ start:463 stop:1200 length:738 start_codon:yes stop_codon:yes gene_type:complete